MDADDVAEPIRFAEQFALLEGRPDLAGCGAGVLYFPRAEVRGGGRRYEDWINAIRTPDDVERNLFIECPLAHPTFFLRADIVANVGGYVERGWPEDYDMLFRVWRSGGRLASVDRLLLRWRIGDDRTSVRHESYTPEAFRRCKVHYLLDTLARDREGLVVWGAGPIGKAFAREVQRQGEAPFGPSSIWIHGRSASAFTGPRSFCTFGDRSPTGTAFRRVGCRPGGRPRGGFGPNSSRRVGRRSPTS